MLLKPPGPLHAKAAPGVALLPLSCALGPEAQVITALAPALAPGGTVPVTVTGRVTEHVLASVTVTE